MTIVAAAAQALCDLAEGDPALVVVTGRDPGVAAEIAAAYPRRHVVAAASRTRLAVADGVARGGKLVVAVLDGGEPVLPPVARLGAVDAVLATDTAWAEAARRAGMVVVQPAWATDVAPLLRAAVEAPVPVLCCLHEGSQPEQATGDVPVLGRPRVLRRGRRGVVAAAGSSVVAAERVGRMLAGRDIAVTVLDVHTLVPDDGWPDALLDGALLVGARDMSTPLVEVPRGDRDPRQLMDAVLAALPAASLPEEPAAT